MSAAPRRPSGTPNVADVLLSGTVFFDLIFSGLPSRPGPGREIRTESLGSSPGGAANVAVALRRLGLRVRLDAAFATDIYGDYLWRTLAEQEDIDLAGSVRFPGWRTPLTVSLAYEADRSMVTYEEPQPATLLGFLDDPRPARSLFAFLGGHDIAWVERAARRGMRIFADVGWDGSERWAEEDLAALSHCEAFMPNAGEAMAYTRTGSPEAACRALARRVGSAVVKCGPDGAIACRAGSDQLIREPALQVEAVDPTGAGDVFDAAFTYAALGDWPLAETLRFANLCAGLSVRHLGGSLSAPTWSEIATWVRAHAPGDERYEFLRPHH
ncbi:MAG: PfkB family carbohydrate kinase [Chloroflexota bacterium]|nr:PfkB family carbohydrate kinase [Chloroflexota bacterium]